MHACNSQHSQLGITHMLMANNIISDYFASYRLKEFELCAKRYVHNSLCLQAFLVIIKLLLVIIRTNKI